MQRYEAASDGVNLATGDNAMSEQRSNELRQSYQRMNQSYQHIMENHETQKRQLANRPGWHQPRTAGSKEPDALTVTHVNQTMDLERAMGLDARNAESQSSEEWLKSHSIDQMKLTLKDLVDKGTIARPASDQDSGKVQQHIQFDAQDINEFEYKLNLAIETFTRRIKWLLQGSRRMFGLIKGDNIGLVIDSSDANCGFGRITHFQEALIHLLDEQLSEKKGLYVMPFGSDLFPLWKQRMDVHCRSIEEAKDYILALRSSGGCNVLRALKHVLKVKGLDTVYLIMGSAPDQNGEILCDFLQQACVGKNLTINTIAYDCNNHVSNQTLRKLAEQTGGRYHCYTSACEDQIYTGTDISFLLGEIQRAQDVINKIKDMRQGLLGTALVTVMNEITNEVAKLPQSRFLPRPPGHELPLCMEEPKFQPMSSDQWLNKHGLKARNLDLYQVLAPNAYSYKEEFIPVIRKTVQSQVHEKAMTQFQWHDGSVKNVHVDMSLLFEYQKQLGASVKLYEKRIDWLSTGSRKIYGSIVEKNVVFLIDLSAANINYLVHIQHSVRLLLEQQMVNKDYFNIIGFGGEPRAWKPTMVPPTPENLQAAWKWILDAQCGGSRNFLGALRLAVENDEESKHGVDVEGVYVFTSGIPDQSQEVVCSYIEEACAGRLLTTHVLLFNVDDYDSHGAIPGRYANITKTAECLRNVAHCSGGRFHWFRETGIIESDDIAALSLEIEKALNFSRKCAMLVESVKKKYNLDYGEMKMLTSSHTKSAIEASTAPKPLPAPKLTALAQARIEMAQENTDALISEEAEPRSLTWRPSSATRRDDGGKRRPLSAKDPMRSVRKPRVEQQFFYTGEKNAVGAVFTKYPNPKSVRKAFKKVLIPDKEMQSTSREWFRMYSLKKLKLDLDKLISGPDCRHMAKPVSTLHKNVNAKTCNVFPTINYQGTLRHLQLLPHELREYEEQLEHALTRYLKRLQWLLSGSRRVFGTVVEKRCAFLIDTSGSMDTNMEELKKDLASLIWDQLYRYKVRFNILRFSGACERWQTELMEPTEENCHDAVKWVSQFVACGNTCTLEALEMAFQHEDLDAIYVLTDGKPDTSTALVLREVAAINENRNIVVNTISFNCQDSTANTFLHMLSKQTSGRYHRCRGDFDAQLFAHKLLSEGFHDHEHPHLPDFEGDDLKKLGAEITQGRRYLAQARSYRAMYEKEKSTVQDKPSPVVGTGAKSATVK